MKLLLDEQMPRRIARHVPADFTVDHAQRVGWETMRNGALLKLAATAGYEASISADKNMSYQQNQSVLPLSVVVLHVYRLKLDTLLPLLPIAIERLRTLSEPAFIRVDVEPGAGADT